MRKVLFAVDFSPYSEALLGRVEELVQLGMEELVLVHVIDSGFAVLSLPELMRTYAEEEIERIEQSIAVRGLNILSIVELGIPARKILEAAEDNQVSLICLGAHGKGFFGHLLMGSVSSKVLRLADKPVLVHKCRIKEEREDYFCENASAPLFESVLITTDFSAYSESIRSLLQDFVAQYCTRITLLHVLEEEDGRPAEEKAAKQKMDLLRELHSCFGGMCQEIEIKLEKGSPSSTILKVAGETRASLIVMGALGHRRLAEKLLGGVAESVVSQSEVPVLVLRAQG